MLYVDTNVPKSKLPVMLKKSARTVVFMEAVIVLPRH